MNIQELDEARWEPLLKLVGAVTAYKAIMAAGYADHTCELVDWLEACEREYVAAHTMWNNLVESGFEIEEEAAA